MSRGALLPKRAKGARRVCIGGCSPHLTGRSGLDSPQGETRYRFRLAPPTPGTDAARERRASASSGARKYVREGVAITAANLVDDGRRGGHLSETEERELRRRAAQYTRPHREVIRAKVGLLAAEGHSDCEIPRRLDCTDKTAGMSDPLAHLWRMDSSSHAPDTTRLCTARAERGVSQWRHEDGARRTEAVPTEVYRRRNARRSIRSRRLVGRRCLTLRRARWVLGWNALAARR
jgi:hypothetical protein